ncbi:hypothetical protein GE09DRAFT_1241061 [Coniochaeta sp. 2T2.1]|nr:hypothetical protein GE09DRAFT_1241061 [Coniochaeta sp. 2T2.1]
MASTARMSPIILAHQTDRLADHNPYLASAANPEAFPFRKLPPELRNIIHFESGLSDYDILALAIATNDPKKECSIVHVFMATQLDHILHEGTLESVLTIQQTIYFTGAQQVLLTGLGSCEREGNAFDFPGTIGHIRGASFDDKLTKTELVRLVLAVYQFRAYAFRIHQGADAMPYEEAAAVSKSFFQHLTPWEKEQIISVSDILAFVTHYDIECGPGSWRLAAMRSTGYAFWDLYTSWCNCHWSPEEYAELFEKETPDEEDEGEDEGEYKGEGLSDEEYSETEDDDDDFAGEEAGVHEDIEEGGIAEDDKAQKATRSPERMSEV